jgi:uncharacterized protein YggT (Ycf19 family)
MEDNKLAADEARRLAQHEEIKSNVEGGVNSEIASQAEVTSPRESSRIEQVAGDFRAKAVDEVVSTDREVERSRTAARVSQVIDYLFFIIYALLAIRLVLALMAARKSAGFTQFIFGITDPFYAPFRGIVASPSVDGGFTLALPIIIALIAYAILHALINGMLRLLAHRKTQV